MEMGDREPQRASNLAEERGEANRVGLEKTVRKKKNTDSSFGAKECAKKMGVTGGEGWSKPIYGTLEKKKPRKTLGAIHKFVEGSLGGMGWELAPTLVHLHNRQKRKKKKRKKENKTEPHCKKGGRSKSGRTGTGDQSGIGER